MKVEAHCIAFQAGHLTSHNWIQIQITHIEIMMEIKKKKTKQGINATINGQECETFYWFKAVATHNFEHLHFSSCTIWYWIKQALFFTFDRVFIETLHTNTHAHEHTHTHHDRQRGKQTDKK